MREASSISVKRADLRLAESDQWASIRFYLRELGFVLPLEAMEGHIKSWHEWMSAVGDFYSYRDTDGFGRIYEVYRMSIHPAMRACQEWGSLLLNDKTMVVCEEQACTDWLSEFFAKTGLMPAAQTTVVKAFGMGTGAWALWVDADARKVRIRHYDARMVLPLSWDEEGVSECAFVTRVFYRGKAFDQLQMHLHGSMGLDGGSSSHSVSSHGNAGAASPSESSPSHGEPGPRSFSESSSHGMLGLTSPSRSSPSHGNEGTYKIITVLFDEEGNIVEPAGARAAARLWLMSRWWRQWPVGQQNSFQALLLRRGFRVQRSFQMLLFEFAFMPSSRGRLATASRRLRRMRRRAHKLRRRTLRGLRVNAGADAWHGGGCG